MGTGLKVRLTLVALTASLLFAPASAEAFEVDMPWVGPTGFDITETLVLRYL